MRFSLRSALLSLALAWVAAPLAAQGRPAPDLDSLLRSFRGLTGLSARFREELRRPHLQRERVVVWVQGVGAAVVGVGRLEVAAHIEGDGREVLHLRVFGELFLEVAEDLQGPGGVVELDEHPGVLHEEVGVVRVEIAGGVDVGVGQIRVAQVEEGARSQEEKLYHARHGGRDAVAEIERLIGTPGSQEPPCLLEELARTIGRPETAGAATASTTRGCGVVAGQGRSVTTKGVRQSG